MKPKAVRKTKEPHLCRYCGHVASDHVREETSQRTMPLYSCRDVTACGDRLRGGEPVPVLGADDCPF